MQRYNRQDRKLVQDGGGTGTCCTTAVLNFALYSNPTKLGYSQTITNSSISKTVTAYGFNLSDNSQAYLSSQNQSSTVKGMGCWVDAGGNYEIDNKHYVQVDVSSLIPYIGNPCGATTISIIDVQKAQGFAIYGSNTLGSIGTPLYSFTASGNANQYTVPLFNPASSSTAPPVYNYISVTALPVTSGSTTNCLISAITVNTCTSCSGSNVKDCAGVCNGTNIKDCAGVCYNPSAGQTTTAYVDCAGVCNGPSVTDCASNCYNPNTSNPPVVMDCAGVCGGPSLLDCADVCFNPTTSKPANAPDCNNVCNGNSYKDCAGKCVNPSCVLAQSYLVTGFSPYTSSSPNKPRCDCQQAGNKPKRTFSAKNH
jgi:hypothetical protein